MTFAEGIAIDEVSETMLAVGAGASISGGKINATDNTVAVLDQIQPMYLTAAEDFSVEGWFNFSSIAAYGGSILTMDMLGTGGTGNRSWLFAILADGRPYFFINSDGGDNGTKLISATPDALNADNHIAICRVGGVMTL